ncbi:MAG: nucleotide exchange factor GrpE [Rhizonema sp. PD37]|nr:nucleotide exchange factor GrpE [Rhizonema sp. PD37]
MGAIQDRQSKIPFSIDFTQKLRDNMQRVGISNFKVLSRTAGVSERQILRLRQFGVEQMRVDVLLKLSQVLQVSLSDLVGTFSQITVKDTAPTQELLQQIADLKREYSLSQSQLEQQRQLLLQEFQHSTLQLLESLLLQFPTAAQKARENPQLPALNIVPLVQKPLERLLLQWGVEAIAPVGAELSYNPQVHQLLEGNAQLGETVKVRYTGYRQADKLLYRAKVSPIHS